MCCSVCDVFFYNFTAGIKVWPSANKRVRIEKLSLIREAYVEGLVSRSSTQGDMLEEFMLF